MPRNCQTTVFTSGMVMDLVSTLIPLALRRGKRGTLGRSMASNGATLVQSTQICMQTIQEKVSTNSKTLFTRLRRIPLIEDLF